MNPLVAWENCRIEEIKNGGKPSVCILGYDDYASFCGALSISYGISPIGADGHLIYQGITVWQSHASKIGTMFA